MRSRAVVSRNLSLAHRLDANYRFDALSRRCKPESLKGDYCGTTRVSMRSRAVVSRNALTPFKEGHQLVSMRSRAVVSRNIQVTNVQESEPTVSMRSRAVVSRNSSGFLKPLNCTLAAVDHTSPSVVQKECGAVVPFQEIS
jgi:hypothetical protein